MSTYRPGHSLGRKIKLLLMKNGKENYGFSYSNSMTIFEVFHWNISSRINLLFLKSACILYVHLNFFRLGTKSIQYILGNIILKKQKIYGKILRKWVTVSIILLIYEKNGWGFKELWKDFFAFSYILAGTYYILYI